MALAITDQNWEELVKNNKYVIMDFWAEWCGPCRAIAPFVEKAAEAYKDRVCIGKVNIDENVDITRKFSIKNIPTLLFIKDGELVDKHVGALREADLMNKIDAFIQ